MQPRDASSIPGPKGQFLIGNALRFERDPITWLRETRDEFGDIVRITSDAIVIHDESDVQRLLLATNTDFFMDKVPRGRKSQKQDQRIRRRVWLDENPYVWRIFSRPTIAAHLDRITQQISAQLEYQADIEQNIFAGARQVCGSTLAEFFLGHDELTGSITEFAAKTADAEVQLNERPESRWVFGPRKTSKYIYSENSRLQDAIRDLIAIRKSSGTLGEQHDALDALVSSFPELADSAAAAIALDGIVAGFSAPGSALSWVVLRLANHPECAELIRQEAEADGSEKAAADNINHLIASYAAAFVKEVLRLHPPHWMIGRRTANRVMIRGYEIPPGYTVLCIPYLIHRDRRWWSDPEEFDPERWRRERIPYSGCAYLPFGHGPRMCPGRFMGQIELLLATIVLATRYTLTLPPLSAVDARYRSLLLPENVEGGWYRAKAKSRS